MASPTFDPPPMSDPPPNAEGLSCKLSDRWRQQLDQLVSEVLNDQHDQLFQILPFIEWKLRSFGLQHKYEARDIFLEAYERAVKLLDREETIQRLPAWLKSTSFNIIREYARKAGRFKMTAMDQQQFANLPELEMTDDMLETKVTWLLSELAQMRADDRAILELRMQGWSYEEIVRQRGGTATALRQRVSRLLRQLRQIANELDA